MIAGVALLLGVGSDDQTLVAFELHAPDARSVELVGSFNGWAVGEFRLDGPDATGHWSITVPLPEGRHEYQFLIDGKRWIADPKATIRRPDGFGRSNAVLEI
jgi:1,4-alpha-glucan branching enzyme